MKKVALLSLFALTVTSCTPAAMESFGRGLAQGSGPITVGVICTGKTYGTFTSAVAELRLAVGSDGRTTGTFTNNGTIFAAQGYTPVRYDGQQLLFSQINLQLDSRVNGSAAALVGVRPVGLASEFGSTGTLTGTIEGNGAFTGTFKGLQGNYRTLLTCRGE